MATARDRYQNHTYSESRDRGRAEHARQDWNICPGCDYDANRCHCNADELDREFDLRGGIYR